MTLLDHYLRTRSKYWRLKRLWFPSPAEIRFMQLMGAKVVSIKRLKSSNGFPMCIVIKRGRVLREAGMKRERRVGKCYVDFGNDIGWAIEIDGTIFHNDVVQDFDREVYMREFLRRQKLDLRILRIPAYRLWHSRAAVQAEVLEFLAA
jgi:very-short-patch-repair endonuclease